MRQTIQQLVKLLMIGLCAASAANAQEAASNLRGTLYTMSNQPDGNSVIVFQRGIDGRLSAAGQFHTRGLGTGAGLGSQGALALDEDRTHLFAVNAGSNEI